MLTFKNAVRLLHRGLLQVRGIEATHFLQGLLTRDMLEISQGTKPSISYALLLNVKGRIVSDLLIYSFATDREEEGQYLLETSASNLTALQRVLSIYKLRKKVDITPLDPSTMAVYFAPETPTPSSTDGGHFFEDPRASHFGYRVIGPTMQISSLGERTGEEEGKAPMLTEDEYLQRRLEWGIPEGVEELADELPVHTNGDWMNGIDFEKGCYIGQELVARSHHSAVIRSRIMPFRLLTPPVASSLVPKDTVVVDKHGKRQGKIICLHGSRGLALMKLELLLKEHPEPLLIKLVDKQMLAGSIEVYSPKWWPSDWMY